MRKLQAPRRRVVLVVFVPTHCMKNVLRIIRVCVEPVVICDLDVATLVTKFNNILRQVPEVSVVILQLIKDCMHFRLALIVKEPLKLTQVCYETFIFMLCIDRSFALILSLYVSMSHA